MKIWLEESNTPINKLSGKGLFSRRLANAFRRQGITVVDSGKADVSINLIGIKHRQSDIKILRLDGVWHDTGKDYKRKNLSLIQSLKQADAVVYQSKFSYAMCNHYLGIVDKPKAVIFNGANPGFYECSPEIQSKYKYNIFVFSKWRPHKRLRDMIESFLLANIKDCALWIAGDITKSGIPSKDFVNYCSRPDIFYLGSINQYEVAKYLRLADATMHLCWFDACPNSVVESICAGVPVVCNNTGGTQELVSISGGYVCQVDEPYNLQPVDLYNPPTIDRNMIARALNRAINEKPKISCEHVLINNIAEQYLEFIGSLL